MNKHQFDLLFRTTQLITTIRHWNAAEECMFSLINKNKTPSKILYLLDGALSSIILVKTRIKDQNK